MVELCCVQLSDGYWAECPTVQWLDCAFSNCPMTGQSCVQLSEGPNDNAKNLSKYLCEGLVRKWLLDAGVHRQRAVRNHTQGSTLQHSLSYVILPPDECKPDRPDRAIGIEMRFVLWSVVLYSQCVFCLSDFPHREVLSRSTALKKVYKIRKLYEEEQNHSSKIKIINL